MKRLLASFVVVNMLGLLTVGGMLIERQRGPTCDDPGTEDCPVGVDLSQLDGRVRYGADDPAFRVYLFVDLGSDAARQTYQELTAVLADSAIGAEVELWVLHAPGERCAPGHGSYSCTAAGVVECAESIAPGVGAAVVGDAFDTRWRGGDEPSAALIESAQRRVSGAKEGPAPSVASCLRSVRAVEERIAAHSALADEIGVRGVGGIVERVDDPTRRVPFGDWLTGAALLRVVACLRGDGCERGGA